MKIEPRLEPAPDKNWETVERMTYAELLRELDERGHDPDGKPSEEEARDFLYSILESEDPNE